MDIGRLLYRLARLYVWLLVVLGLGTVILLVLPRNPPNATLAGVWFAVGGFGALGLVIAVMVYFYE